MATALADENDKSGQTARRAVLRWLWTVVGPFLGLVLISLLFGYLTRGSGTFFSGYNWRTIAVHTVIVGTAALGMTAVMIGGGIDLTVGSVVALVTGVLARLVRDVGLPMPAALGCGVLAGGLCGLANGALITRLGVTPFIITLGGMTIFRGLAASGDGYSGHA